MLKINVKNPHVTKYRLLPIGTEVKCLNGVPFVDGQAHVIGDEFVVSKETQAYFSAFTTLGEYSVI